MGLGEQRGLHLLLEASAKAAANQVAFEEADGASIAYGDLDRLANRVRDLLVARDVAPGDRVAIYLRKSIDAVAAIFGVLKAGGAYVPIDPGSPAARAAYILNDCQVRVAFVERDFLPALLTELTALGGRVEPLVLESVGGGAGLAAVIDQASVPFNPDPTQSSPGRPDDLAYLLYTSGSTGKPKGVMLSHRAALAFVDWCSEVVVPSSDDRFSSHAPFHFDLSILDLYLPIKHAARVVLIGEDLGKEPLGLAALIAERRLTVWYSTPSILNLLNQFGKLERHDLSHLRVVLFAGEVFPIPQLRTLKARLGVPRYLNLFGPTETNVCTYFELPPGPVPDDRVEPYPIGRACSHYRWRVVDETGADVVIGEEGELLMAGPAVMSGYWNLPERNAEAFVVDARGERWYRTGDLVVDHGDGVLLFHGRRDRMVKRRGYRIELGEIEAGLATHPAIGDVAVVAVPDQASGVRIVAFLVGRVAERPSIVDLKRFCAERLPKYMAPDMFRFVEILPRTSTDKTDYQRLKALV